MSKDSKTFRLSNNDIEYIKNVAQTNKIDNTKALEKIISEHRQQNDNRQLSRMIATDLLAAFDEKYNKTFTRIRLAASGADQSALILLEMMNTLLVATEHNKVAYTSRIAKSEVWTQCETVVKDRIAHYKQKTDSKKVKPSGKD